MKRRFALLIYGYRKTMPVKMRRTLALVLLLLGGADGHVSARADAAHDGLAIAVLQRDLGLTGPVTCDQAATATRRPLRQVSQAALVLLDECDLQPSQRDPPSTVPSLVLGDSVFAVPASSPRIDPAPRSAQSASAAASSSGYPVAVGQSFRDCDDCPELVVIPAGRFVMGSPRSERGRESTEGPQREVVLSHPLAVGKYEVTFDEWDACEAAGWCTYRPDSAGWGRGRLPVMRVAWEV